MTDGVPAPRSGITGVPGWETAAEQDLLVKLAGDVPKVGLIVEVGAEYGMSASLFAHGAHPSVRIVSIDLFPDDLLKKHRDNLATAGFAGRTRQVQMDSHGPDATMLTLWNRAFGFIVDQPSRIDLLFIDGDHTYAGAGKDIQAWTPHVRAGGRVAFHDCACATNRNPHPLHFEVTRAISEWQQAEGHNWKLIHMVDSVMVFERVGE